jgi:hypothetical protein
VHIESAGASEKTCARFAIPGSSLNTWETPDSFARGATEALRVGFQPTKKMATALERTRRKTFVGVTKLRPVERSGRRCLPAAMEVRVCRRSVHLRNCDRRAVAKSLGNEQVLKERIGASED